MAIDTTKAKHALDHLQAERQAKQHRFHHSVQANINLMKGLPSAHLPTAR